MPRTIDYEDFYSYLIGRYGNGETHEIIKSLAAFVDFKYQIQQIRSNPSQKIDLIFTFDEQIALDSVS